jgi:ABC-type branched-subunit amino acid transport system substrate-binding protein
MKKARVIAVIAVVLLAVISVITSCKKKEAEVITIGASICSEGAYALVGVPYGNFYKAYVEYINQAPEYKDLLKGRTLKYIIYDDKGDGAAGKNYIERLVHDDKVDALVGILGTWNVIAAKDVLETAGIPSVYFGTGTSAQMFEPATGDQRYMMGVQPLYKTEGRLMYLRAVTSFQNVKSIGVVFSTADDGTSLRDGIQQQAALDTRANKPQVIYQSISSQDAASITSQIAAIQNCDVIIAAGNQAYFKAVYSAAYANSVARPKPVITSYVNASPTNIPPEAVNANAAGIYSASWVVFYETDPQSAEAVRRQNDYAEYVKIVDWAVANNKYIPASEKQAYYYNAYAMSSYIAVKMYLEGISRLNASGKPLTPANYLEAMESKRAPVAISGGVNYAGGNRIGLDALSFVKYVKSPSSNNPADGGFEEIDPMASIDDLIAKLSK